ncbi:hypothetical protein FQ005_25935, partial [Escherichia coli]
LIAGLLLPSSPALAADYSDQVLGNGGTSSSMSLGVGDTATNTALNSAGYQYVSSGGSAMSTTINSAGYQHIYSGGSATNTAINSGGGQYVSSGG